MTVKWGGRGLGHGGRLARAVTPVDYGLAIANIVGGTANQSAPTADYLLTKTAGDGYDNGDWNSAALTGVFDLRFIPRGGALQYTRLGFSSLSTGRTATNTGTNCGHLFFDEYGRVRFIDAAGTVQWENNTGNTEANFTDQEYWWLSRDASNVLTARRGGTGTKASATLVASLNTTLSGLGPYTGSKYFYASIGYQNKFANAKIIA